MLTPRPTARWSTFAADNHEVLLVLAAVVVGLVAHRPLQGLDDHHGIDALLVVLTFSSALLIPADAFARLRATAWQLAIGLLVGVTLLPLAAWAVSFLVAVGPLRHGMLGVGVAPCEIASVATVSMAGGEVALAAAMLIGSTLVAVVEAGPVLALQAGHGTVRPWPLVTNLTTVVAIPLLVGFLARRRLQERPRLAALPPIAGTVALTALVALVSAEVRLSVSYLRVSLAALAFLAISAAIGAGLAALTKGPGGTALLLTVSMRDFAIAAGLVSVAFGPKAAAPLAIYGVLALVWGLVAAGTIQRRSAPATTG